MLNGEVPLRQKIEQYVAYTTDTLAENPAIASFVAHELQQHPGRLMARFGDRKLFGLSTFRQQLLATENPQHRAPNAAGHLFANMVALCVYPVLAQPLLHKSEPLV